MPRLFVGDTLYPPRGIKPEFGDLEKPCNLPGEPHRVSPPAIPGRHDSYPDRIISAPDAESSMTLDSLLNKFYYIHRKT